MIPTPIERLQEGLKELKSALRKSEDLFAKNELTAGEHIRHRQNLEPKIKEYRTAIAKLLE